MAEGFDFLDLESFNCPQYVSFSSDFAENDTNMSSGSQNFSNQDSLIKGDQDSEDQYIVHTRTTRSQTLNLKKKATVPKPFHFQTDTRIKKNNPDNTVQEEKEFTTQLRKHKVPQPTTSGITKVQPFNLTEAKKKEAPKFLSLAEQINAFHKKTPDRYHTSVQKDFQPQEHWSPPKLQPKTPNLQAVKRRRVVDFLSREEQENKEIEEIKAYEFHANPIDPRIYKPDCVVKTGFKKTTKAEDINLKTTQRLQERFKSKSSEKPYKFRARSVPKDILERPTGIGKKPETVVTKPKSPSFITEKRIKKRKSLEQKREAKERAAKKPKVEKQLPKPVKPVKLKKTEIKPFSFDNVDKERFELKKKKIEEEIEKENRPYKFKAQLMPTPEPSKLPQVVKKPATKPEPFNFNLDHRAMKTSFCVEEKSVSFKARPATVLEKEPFIPEKLTKQIIEIKEFDLQTDRRASERLKLKELNEAKELEREEMFLKEKAIQEEKEHQEILKLRKELVHKANPIRQFKPVEIKPSEKPLTHPISPHFESDKRIQSRLEYSSNVV